MASIDVELFQNLSAASLMIKIWEFSEHVYQNLPPDDSSCNCLFYLACYIEAARQVWNDSYMHFNIALYRFQFQRNACLDIMSCKNERYKEHLVHSILTE